MVMDKWIIGPNQNKKPKNAFGGSETHFLCTHFTSSNPPIPNSLTAFASHSVKMIG